MTAPRDLWYMVSRFPVVSETFIVRELDAISVCTPDVRLRSLFPAPPGVVHPIAQPWVPRNRRPGAAAAIAGVVWACVRHPIRFLRALAVVVTGYGRRPEPAARALITFALACAHSKEISAGLTSGEFSAPPHIHAHYATYPALAAWVCRELTGATYSFTAHAHDLYVDTSMLRRKVRDAEFVVTISGHNRGLLTALDAGPTPIHIVHCGIDTTAYHYRPRTISADRPIRALCVASLQEYKGHAILLRALALGGTAVDGIELELIGSGALRDELDSLAKQLGISQRVRFRGGQTEDQVRAALDAADLFVLPSIVARDGQMEGLPVALMEALACGVPTVSTSLSGIPEIVVEGVTGHLAEPGDARSLNDALTRAVTAHDGNLSNEGRALVEREFDIARTTAALTELLDHARRRPTAP